MTPLTTRRINKAFRDYYALLDSYHEHGQMTIESTTETAMKRLLGDWCSMLGGWTLIKESIKTPRGRSIIPDGIIRDHLNSTRGFWEAKDEADDLESEIEIKRRQGYPFDKNLLFDDTQTAVLFQNDARLGECDIRDRDSLERMLTDFFAWSTPDIDGFHEAMEHFYEDLPRFAEALRARIEEAKGNNKRFVEQLNRFYEVCRESLNPAVTISQIEEMLAQHLLTERIARRVFHYDRFRQNNAIAHELENLVDAFLEDAPSRDDYMRGLNHYFAAVERRAANIYDISEKQDFLTKVYEPFLNVYSPRDADRLGIVYTPQPIVRFIVNSVEAALNEHFGKSLADRGVHILDPCTGTGNFIIAVLEKINDLRPSALEYKYKREIWANEILLLPYYIAGLNIHNTYHELTGEHAECPGVCFTDTLLLNQVKQQLDMVGLSEENARKVKAQEEAEITVILGNPPYNAWQEYENQGAKNAPHDTINERIKQTYAKDSRATNLNSLYDPYIQFIRWATDRLGETGVVSYVTNNGFLDGYAASGMRKHLVRDFSEVYHYDLRGNVRKNPKISGTTHNVFGIQVGVGISLLVRDGSDSGKVYYQRQPEFIRKEERYDDLDYRGDYRVVDWKEPKLTKDGAEWFAPETDFEELPPLGNKQTKKQRLTECEAIFLSLSNGVKTNRDAVVYDYDEWQLEQRVKAMIEAYNLEIDRWKRSGQPTGRALSEFVDTDKVNWSRDLKKDLTRERYVAFSKKQIRTSLYRPFMKSNLYFDRVMNEEIYQWHQFLPTPAQEEENRVIVLTDKSSEKPFMSVISNWITDLHYVGAGCQAQCFPLYVYDEDGFNRRLNVTPWAIELFRERYSLPGDYYDQRAGAGSPDFGPVTPWRVFHYVYAVLHARGYREKYEANLKKSLPRVPLLGEAETFQRLARLGEDLARQHLDYESAARYELERIEKPLEGKPFDWACPRLRVDRKDRSVIRYNKQLTLKGVPERVHDYRLGNRSAVEWVCNQYKKYPAKDDFVIQLLERVITVSLATLDLVDEVNAMWEEHAGEGGEYEESTR